MPKKVIPIDAAQQLFPDFQPSWLARNPECNDPASVAIGSPRFGTIRHVVVIETNNDGTPIKPLWDQIQIEEGPKDRDFPGVIIVPYFWDDGGKIHVVLRQRHRPTRGTNALEFPQGGIEDNETLEQCARRELIEETGLRPRKIITLTPVCAEPDWFPRDTKIVAVLVDAAAAFHQCRSNLCSIYPIANLEFSDRINSATSVAALLRLIACSQTLAFLQ